MLHFAPRLRRPWIALATLLALLWLAAPPASRPAAAAPGQAPASSISLTANPSALAISVPLGQARTAPIALTNGSSQALTPAIYEANPEAQTSALLAPQSAALRAVALPVQAERVDPQLVAQLGAAPDRAADFVVYLRDQADLSAAYQIRDWAARGRYVYQTLNDFAARSQIGLRAQLARRGLPYRPLWIANAILTHGNAADANALAARADVALVRANRTSSLPPERALAAATSDQCSPDQSDNPICWNIRKIGADRVWRDFGVAGQGVVVANIDTGVEYTHPALALQYRGYLAPGRYDHNYNWFDPLGASRTPQDSAGHGTHTMGTIVGAGNGTLAQPAVGVAPRARWIAAAGCTSLICDEANLIEAAQWMLAPTDLDGNNPRPDLRPMIVNNSWAGPGGNNFYSGYIAAWRAAGLFPIFAAGNTGTNCGSIASPADDANATAVGATNLADDIASFSARGPTADNRRKPDFVAPGQAILSAFPGSGAAYQLLQGTSMATPHVAGLVALLWSANPALIGDYDATYALMRDTARPIGDTQCGGAAGGPNNVYGYGRIDTYAAVARARVDVPWLAVSGAPATLSPNSAGAFNVTLDAAKVPGPGTYHARLQVFGGDLTQPLATVTIALTVTPIDDQATVTGRVVSAGDGAPVAASVGVNGGLGVRADSTGTYTLTLAPGAYNLVASAPAFVPATLAITAEAQLRAPDIALQPILARLSAPTSPLSATIAIGEHPKIALPIGNAGNQELYYQARVLPDRFGAARSDEPGGPQYQWIELPASAVRLNLNTSGYQEHVPVGFAFPFYNHVQTETVVAANGTLGFFTPTQPLAAPTSACLPDTGRLYEIAPFRADLDLARGGVVRYGTVAGPTFVVSYENVPRQNGPLGETYTFQVLLQPDGRIVFQYRALGPAPNILAVGVQNTADDYQALSCGAGAGLHDGLAIELLPQANAASWLRLDRADGTLPPGQQQQLGLQLGWSPPDRATPLRGRIEIVSTDPTHPRLIIPLSANMRPAPYRFWVTLPAT